MSSPEPMMLYPFIAPPLIANNPDEKPCVMSWGETSGAFVSWYSGPGVQTPSVHVSVPPFVVPSAPG